MEVGRQVPAVADIADREALGDRGGAEREQRVARPEAAEEVADAEVLTDLPGDLRRRQRLGEARLPGALLRADRVERERLDQPQLPAQHLPGGRPEEDDEVVVALVVPRQRPALGEAGRQVHLDPLRDLPARRETDGDARERGGTGQGRSRHPGQTRTQRDLRVAARFLSKLQLASPLLIRVSRPSSAPACLDPCASFMGGKEGREQPSRDPSIDGVADLLHISSKATD